MTFRSYNIQQPPATCPWLQGTVYRRMVWYHRICRCHQGRIDGPHRYRRVCPGLYLYRHLEKQGKQGGEKDDHNRLGLHPRLCCSKVRGGNSEKVRRWGGAWSTEWTLGNGTDRRNRLTKEGYNYKEVQQRVNELTKGEYVTVNPGDTLSKIAEIHRTSVAEILNLNSTLIKNPGSIRVGWKIKVK